MGRDDRSAPGKPEYNGQGRPVLIKPLKMMADDL